jgi:AcrR family transcriptional regulator
MSEYTDRQRQIIEAAVELIAEGGIQELTMKRLAQRIGISEPAIYRHFENKLDILEAIQQVFAGEKRRFMEQILKSNVTAIKKIVSIMEHHFASFTAKPALAAVLFSEGIFQNDQRLKSTVLKIMQQSAEVLGNIVKQGQTASTIRDDIAPQDLVTVILGALRLIVNRWHLQKCSFDLVAEGNEFIGSLKNLLRKN